MYNKIRGEDSSQVNCTKPSSNKQHQMKGGKTMEQEKQTANAEENKEPNIKKTGWSSKTIDTTTERVLLKLNQFANITLSPFAIRQIMSGAHLLLQQRGVKAALKYDETHLLSRLAIHIAYYAEDNESDRKVNVADLLTRTTFGITRNEMFIMREWLETRMTHCEEELENRVMIGEVVEKGNVTKGALKFNKETYVTMKLLLLDIREWLLGTAVEDED